MKLEVGKNYRTRYGDKAVIEEERNGDECSCPFVGKFFPEHHSKGLFGSWTEDGRWNSDRVEHLLDIIAPWEDQARAEFYEQGGVEPKLETHTTEILSQKNEPAFPLNLGSGDYHSGLSKREYFAAMAMQGIISKNPFAMGERRSELRDITTRIANGAVQYADALIAALERGRE